jgi:hypothetical protein
MHNSSKWSGVPTKYYMNERMTNETLSWDKHIEGRARKLSTACYIIRSAKIYMSTSSLKTIYYAVFNSLMTYGIIFWGISSLGATIFRL